MVQTERDPLLRHVKPVRCTQCYTAAKDEDCSSVMKFQVCKREARTCLPKYGCIFLFLVVFVLSCVIDFKDIMENTVKSIIYISHTDRHYNFCQFQPLSLKEAYEEHLLLKSIAWPETRPLPFPFYLSKTSDPSHSTFTILSGREGGQWQKGDNLEVLIKIYDFHGHPKKSGGDVLLARLHNPALGAGVAGQVVDHLNGSYSTVFYLPWEGNAEVEVTLVHPSEAVTVLRRLTRKHPDRIYFKSLFRSGSISEITTCNVCLRPTQRPVCNYTDRRTGEPWFCYKPENLSCDARIDHSKGTLKRNFMTMETLFQRGVNMKVFVPASGSASVTILPKKEDRSMVNSHSLKSRPSGYYYHGVWRALHGTAVRHFNTSSAISQCLKGKVVHMYGDSTIRQWFEHFNTSLPDLKEFNLHSQKKIGPYMALDNANNILVTYRCHGPPIRFSKVPVSELRYIANELDSVTGGSDTVVVLGIWAHFSTFPIELYIRRLQSIRRAVVRLLSRAPDTRVVVRTANPKNLTLYEAITNSDWYSLQQDNVLKTMFKGLNVHLVDAWEMVVAHYLPHSLHPQPPIIENMINVLLSYICPKKGD